jgi:glutamate-1-semialdehyde 2,1-aminomutase
MASIEHRSGSRKMRHPGTFNANPLSAAAGVAALQIVATGEPCRRANETARKIRQKLNAVFAERNLDWIAHGEFSGFRLLANYHGPRPTDDSFIPYDCDPDKLDAPRDTRLHMAFRQAMLLQGVDVWGLSGMTSIAQNDLDVAQTVDAIVGAIEMVQL